MSKTLLLIVTLLLINGCGCSHDKEKKDSEIDEATQLLENS